MNWKLPLSAQYKCNSVGVVKGNLGPSSVVFFIRNHQGDLIFIEVRRIPDTTNLVAEIVALRLGLEHCVNHGLFPVILETNSLSVQKFLTRQWDTPWCISADITKILDLMKGREAEGEHTFREGNQMADSLANYVFFFAGTDFITFPDFQ